MIISYGLETGIEKKNYETNKRNWESKEFTPQA